MPTVRHLRGIKNMGKSETCHGCEYMCKENAGRGHVFFICGLGKFERASRPVFDYQPESVTEPAAPVPAWCKLGRGKDYRKM